MKIKNVVVIGSGTMGSGIAAHLCNANVPVTLLDLKTEISDKILVNGKIGVPVGGIEENVIIGDVQIEFLLNDEGNLKARFFNKENEYQYFGNDIGYTQGMGISYEIDFNNIKNIFKKNNKSKSRKTSN